MKYNTYYLSAYCFTTKRRERFITRATSKAAAEAHLLVELDYDDVYFTTKNPETPKQND